MRPIVWSCVNQSRPSFELPTMRVGESPTGNSVMLGADVTEAVAESLAVAPVVLCETLIETVLPPVDVYVCEPLMVKDPDPPVTVPVDDTLPSPQDIVAEIEDAVSEVTVFVSFAITPLTGRLVVATIVPTSTTSWVLQVLPRHTLPPVQATGGS